MLEWIGYTTIWFVIQMKKKTPREIIQIVHTSSKCGKIGNGSSYCVLNKRHMFNVIGLIEVDGAKKSAWNKSRGSISILVHKHLSNDQ